jgi:D-sedoheptulose 7-phosphate isomerase
MSDADFLYPMIDRAGGDASALLADLTRSAREKIAISAELTGDSLAAWGDVLDAAARDVVARLQHGGRLFLAGNGGSATDADGVAALFAAPPRGLPVAARSLVADVSVVTALANDVGFDEVFARQFEAHATEHDVLVGFSTSGNSTNLLRGFRVAHARGAATIGFAGDRGGAMATCGDVDHLVIVRASSIHRIQEAQSALAHALWGRVQHELGVDAAPVDTHGGAPR